MTATFSPETADEVVQAVGDTRAAGGALEIRGGGSVLDRLAPSETTLLSTAGLTGIVSHDAEDLTVTVQAGTSLEALAAALAEHGQESPIEAAAGAGTTVGGRIATGLAGPRQLGAGRVRDWLLRVRFVAGTGQLAKAGGVTVKDVTGYDLCRLLAGSWGTVGVITEVTLKLRPIARHAGWFVTAEPQPDLDARLFRPAALFTSPACTYALLEGHPDDVAEQAAVGELRAGEPPELPRSARASVDPSKLPELRTALAALDIEVTTQDAVGVGYLDVADGGMADAREVCESLGGSLLVLDPTSGLPAFGRDAATTPMAARVRAALDPDGVLAPHRWR